MKTYLEFKDEKSQKFWEIYSEGNNVITRYGKIDTEGKKIIKTHPSSTIAVFEMHKQIVAKRNKGYATPNVVSMAELMKYEKTTLSDLDSSLYSSLEGDHYESVIYIDGNINLESLFLDEMHEYTNGIIINGDLKVDGGIENYFPDYGPFLIVTGNVLADYVIGAGSEIYLKGESYVQTFTTGYYNHGSVSLRGFSLFLITEEYHCDGCLIKTENDINYEFRLAEGSNMKKFIEIFDGKSSFIDDFEYDKEDYYDEDDYEEEDVEDYYLENFYVNIDLINKEIMDDKKRIKLLSQFINNLEH